jgi:arylsulfatase A-like enzyme
VAIGLCAIILGIIPPLGGATAEPPRPSVVLILTDDQRFDSLWAMPIVQRELVNRGITFPNAFVVNPLCCPSRTSILTGRYSHGTGVYTNRPPEGGFEAFLKSENSTVATWLHKAGYTTALIGKYLNHYGDAGRAGYVPPGWDDWEVFALDLGRYYNYPLNENGTIRHYHHTRADYSTNLLGRRAVSFIRRTDGPLYLEVATTAPHAPATPDPFDRGRYRGVNPWRPPNYDEQDVSDKPEWVKSLDTLTAAEIHRLDSFHERQDETLLAVDRMVGRIVQALRDTGRLHNTLIVFTSDNGLTWGEHRWGGKKDAYEESIRVPMVVRYDNMVEAPREDTKLVTNIDLAPTFAQLGGTTAPRADGLSMVPLLASPDANWRNDFLVEHVQDQDAPVPTYCAVRGTRFVYTVYATGEEELYDLETDPYELNNQASNPDSLPTLLELRQRAKQLCNPPPPGFTFPY